VAKRAVVPAGKQRVRKAEGVYLKASGRYLATFRDPGRKRHWKEFTTLGEAKRWRAKALVDPSSVTDGRRSLAQVWEDYLKHQAGGLARTTLATMNQEWKVHIGPRLGSWPVGRITVLVVKEFLAELERAGVGVATRQKCRAILHRVLEEAVENGEIHANPAATRGTRVKRDTPRKARILTPAEVRKVLSVARDRLGESDGLAIEVMFTLGLRIGEVAGLQAHDVDRERREITVARTITEVGGVLRVEDHTKSRKVRVIPVPQGLSFWARLLRYMNDRGLIGKAHLFPSTEGTVMRPNNWRRRVWGRVMDEAGIPEPPSPHSGRRTTASLLSHAGVPPSTVRAILAHATLRMTDGYVDVPREEMEEGLGRLALLYERE
jgi:integrase